MGFSLSWLAFKNPPRDVALERLGLKATGDLSEDLYAPISGRALRGGRYLIVATKCDSEIIAESSLEKLSAEAEVVACSIEEHVMFCSAECRRLGRRVWRVAHDAQQSARHIEATGALPPEWAAILEQVREQQDEEDAGAREVDFFFEAPLELARGVTGFKHDADDPILDDASFEVLQWIRPKRRWWRFWI